MGNANLIPRIKDNNWTSVRQAVAKLASSALGPSSSPTFAGLTLGILSVDHIEEKTSGHNVVFDNILSATVGTEAAPSYTFTGFEDTGMYYIHSNKIGFSTGGSLALRLDSYGVMIIDGVVDAPSYSFLNDDNSGFYLIGADNIGLSLNGVKRVDFAVAGTTIIGNLTTTGNAGIGTASPDSGLHIKASIPGIVGDDYAGQLIIQSPTNDVNTSVVITGYKSDASGDPDVQLWYLGSSSSGNEDIVFLNRRNAKLALGTNDIHRLTILGNGNVGINTAIPAAKLSINGGLHVGGNSDPGDNNLLVDGTFSDGTASLSGGNLTGMGNITGADVNISAGTGDYTSTGKGTFKDLEINPGNVANALIEATNSGLQFTRVRDAISGTIITGQKQRATGGNLNSDDEILTFIAKAWDDVTSTYKNAAVLQFMAGADHGGEAPSQSTPGKLNLRLVPDESGTARNVFTWESDGSVLMPLDNQYLKFGVGITNLQIGSDGTNGIIDVFAALRLGNITTNYTEISSTGDLVFVGSAGLPFGEMHQQDGSTFNVTMTTVNVWVEVDAVITNISATELNLCTFPDDHYILCQKAGKYLVTYSFTAEINSVAGGDQHVESGIMVNDVIQTDKGEGHEQYAATNKERNLQGHTIIDTPANGQISLAIRNTTSSGKILTIDHLNMTITQLGGT